MRFGDLKHVERIAALNDQFRQTFKGGILILGQKVRFLPQWEQSRLFKSVKTFDGFNDENDPYKEHDFGCVWLNDQRYYFQIYYYDLDLRNRSSTPHIKRHTKRVLIITRHDELQSTSIHNRILLWS